MRYTPLNQFTMPEENTAPEVLAEVTPEVASNEVAAETVTESTPEVAEAV